MLMLCFFVHERNRDGGMINVFDKVCVRLAAAVVLLASLPLPADPPPGQTDVPAAEEAAEPGGEAADDAVETPAAVPARPPRPMRNGAYPRAGRVSRFSSSVDPLSDTLHYLLFAPLPRYEVVPADQREWGVDLAADASWIYRATHSVLRDHLHIGVQKTEYEPLGSLSRVGLSFEEYFLGSIDELRLISDKESTDLTFGLYLNRNFGVEYRSEEMAYRTFTDSTDNHSDGDIVIEGDVYVFVLRLPLDQILWASHHLFGWPYDDEGPAYNFLAHFVPYYGIPEHNLEARFDHAAWWQLGYGSPASYEALGRPNERRNGNFRFIDLSGDIRNYELYGFCIRALDHLWVDFNYSSVEVTVSLDYSLRGVPRDSGVIELDYDTKSVGLRYFF